MRKIPLIILLIFIAIPSFAQTAEELNTQSKAFLDKQDFKNAIPLLKRAAEKGNAEAQYNLGVSYQQGIEVAKSDSLANLWFIKAATQGHKDAQFKVAYHYATGRAVKQDYQKAFYWSVKCAEQNDVECMYNVISCYMEGRGTTVNFDSMLVWATRIALLETPEDLKVSGQITSARANLAMMYREGEKVLKDLEKSYMWFLIYNESKRDFSLSVQQNNIEVIKSLEQQLSTAQRDTAKANAEKVLNRKLTNLSNLFKPDL